MQCRSVFPRAVIGYFSGVDFANYPPADISLKNIYAGLRAQARALRRARPRGGFSAPKGVSCALGSAGGSSRAASKLERAATAAAVCNVTVTSRTFSIFPIQGSWLNALYTVFSHEVESGHSVLCCSMCQQDPHGTFTSRVCTPLCAWNPIYRCCPTGNTREWGRKWRILKLKVYPNGAKCRIWSSVARRCYRPDWLLSGRGTTG